MALEVPDRPVRIVCFDWGGVLLRICRSWQEACARASLPVHQGVETAEARARRHQVSIAYQEGRLTSREYHERLSGSTEGVYTPADIKRLHDCYLIEEYPGVDALVDRLHQTPGVQSALLSNTNHDHWVRQSPGELAHFPTAARLKHRHASHLLGLAKPDPGIYSAFESLTGARGADILFFDDMDENIVAAQALGWRAERIDHTGDTAAQMAAHLRTHGVW